MGKSELASSLERRLGNPYADVVPGMVLGWEEREGVRYVMINPVKMVELNRVVMIDRKDVLEHIRDEFDPRDWRTPTAVKVKGRENGKELVFMAPYDGHMRTRAASENPEIVQQIGVNGGIEYQDSTQKAFKILKIDPQGRDFLTPVEYAKLVNTGIYAQEEVAGARKAAHVMIAWEQQLRPKDSELSGLAALTLLSRDRQDPRRMVMESKGISEDEKRAMRQLSTLVVSAYGLSPHECMTEALWVMAENREAIARIEGMHRQLSGVIHMPEVQRKLAEVSDGNQKRMVLLGEKGLRQMLKLVGSGQTVSDRKKLLQALMADVQNPAVDWNEITKLIKSPSLVEYERASINLKREKTIRGYTLRYLRDHRQKLWVGKYRAGQLETQFDEVADYLSEFEDRMLTTFAFAPDLYRDSALGYVARAKDAMDAANTLIVDWDKKGRASSQEIGQTGFGFNEAVRTLRASIKRVEFFDESDYRKFKAVVDGLRGDIERQKLQVQREVAVTGAIKKVMAKVGDERGVDAHKAVKLGTLIRTQFDKELENQLRMDYRRTPDNQDIGAAASRVSSEMLADLEVIADHSIPNLKAVVDGKMDYEYALRVAEDAKREARNREKASVSQPEVVLDIEWLRNNFTLEGASKLRAELEKNSEIPDELRRILLTYLRVLQAQESRLSAPDQVKHRMITEQIIDTQGTVYEASKTGR